MKKQKAGEAPIERWLERLTDAQRRAVLEQGYLRATQRPRCETCKQFVVIFLEPPERHDQRVELRCDLAGFPVNRHGICNLWAPVRVR